MLSGLGTYAQAWASNGFIFKLFNSSLSPFSINSYLVSKLVCAGIFAVLWFYVCFGKRTVIEKMFIAVTSLFLLSPVGDPWYFCWVIPFLCIYRRYSLIALSFLLILHYFVFTRDFGMFNIGGFKIDNLLLMQYVPFYILLLIERRFNYSTFNKINHRNAVS